MILDTRLFFIKEMRHYLIYRDTFFNKLYSVLYEKQTPCEWYETIICPLRQKINRTAKRI